MLSPTTTFASETKPYALFDSQSYFSYLPNAADVITSPLRWDQDDWVVGSSVLGVAGLAYFVETPLNKWILITRLALQKN